MINLGKRAKILFLDGHFDIMESGDHVICAVTGRRIQLGQLKYWSVDHQEAYADAAVALERRQSEVGKS